MLNPLIEAAFAEYSIPINFLTYSGKETTYLTYYTVGETPSLHADNEPKSARTRASIIVHANQQIDPSTIIDDVKTKMAAADFSWTSDGPDMLNTETNTYEKTIDFYYERGI